MNTEKVCGVYFTFTQSWCPDSLYLHTPRLTLPENRIEHRTSSGFCSGVSSASESDQACLRAHMLTVLYMWI